MDKRLTQAESDAAVELLNEAGDRTLAALKRVQEDTGVPMGNAVNGVNDALANARIRLRAYTEKGNQE